jgi:prophage regulatory protein
MTDKLIRIKTVMDITGKSRSAIYADIANGCFPSSILIGARSVAWAESAISAWVKAKIDAIKPKSKEEIEQDEFDKKAVAAARAKHLEREEI